MDRKSKEEYIEKAWEHFSTEEDNVEMPTLAYLTDDGLDAMYSYYSYCYQEEKGKLELKEMREEIFSNLKKK